MTDRQPGAPGDEPTPDIEPEATEVAAVPNTEPAASETTVAPESADDEMAEEADTDVPTDLETGVDEEPNPGDFEDEAEPEEGVVRRGRSMVGLRHYAAGGSTGFAAA